MRERERETGRLRELGRGKIKKKKKVSRVESGLDRDIDRVKTK